VLSIIIFMSSHNRKSNSYEETESWAESRHNVYDIYLQQQSKYLKQEIARE